MAVKKSESVNIEVEIKTGMMEVCIVGRTPLILARLSEKARQELLMPKGRKSAAERKGNLKHDPIEEYRAAPYITDDDDAPYLFELLSTAFKKAIMGAAVDIPGATKAQIGRCLWVEGQRIGVYGAPRLFMAITRSADMARTPDVRTRCILPKWAVQLRVSFVKPILNERTIGQLLGAAGLIQGVGDWRPEKGSGNYGQFEIVSPDDKEFGEIVSKQGREAQQAGMDNPVCYDAETQELMDWFGPEAKRRGFEVVA